MSRRRIALLLAASLVVGARAALALPATAAPSRGVAPAAVTPPSNCTVIVSKTALPAIIRLGETVDVTLTTRVDCPEPPLHVVFVLDASGNMAGDLGRDLKRAATTVLRSLEMDRHPGVKVGVVSFNSEARTLCRLTDNEAQVLACINKIGAGGGTAIEAGIAEGHRVLQQARSRIDRDLLAEVMIVVSDGQNAAGCDPAVRAAQQVKSDRVLVVAVSLCEGCSGGDDCMRRLATSARYFFKGNSASLWTLMAPIRDRAAASVRSMVISDTVHGDVEYVVGSARPAPARTLPGPSLAWEFAFAPASGVTMWMRVRPLRTGMVSTNVTATGVLTDWTNRLAHWVFPLPKVNVIGPTAPPPPTPTPTTAPATPSATATQAPPTVVPTDTPTAVPTDTPAPRPAPAFLPALSRATG